MTGNRNHSTFVTRREMPRVRFRLLGWPYTIAGTVQHDRRHSDRWTFRQALFERIQRWIAWRVAIAVPIRLDRHVDEVWVVKAFCRGLKRSIVELPVR